MAKKRYFMDTEFIESFVEFPRTGPEGLSKKRLHFIDLISIGIVCDDGREYYAESGEFDESYADDWVKENVITKLGPVGERKTNIKIAFDLLNFFGCKQMGDFEDGNAQGWIAPPDIQVYGYYADYDWVVFCSLFGRMVDLPKNFPFYCRDLKQILDNHYPNPQWKKTNCPDPVGEHNALVDARWNKLLYNKMMGPKQRTDELGNTEP